MIHYDVPGLIDYDPLAGPPPLAPTLLWHAVVRGLLAKSDAEFALGACSPRTFRDRRFFRPIEPAALAALGELPDPLRDVPLHSSHLLVTEVRVFIPGRPPCVFRTLLDPQTHAVYEADASGVVPCLPATPQVFEPVPDDLHADLGDGLIRDLDEELHTCGDECFDGVHYLGPPVLCDRCAPFPSEADREALRPPNDADEADVYFLFAGLLPGDEGSVRCYARRKRLALWGLSLAPSEVFSDVH